MSKRSDINLGLPEVETRATGVQGRSLTRVLLQPLLLPFLLLVLVALLLVTSLQTIARDTQYVTDSQTRLALLRQMMTDISNMENGERGFVITGQTEFLKPYTQGRMDFQKHLSEYRPRIITERQRHNLTRLIKAVETWEEDSAGPEIAARRDSLDRAVQLVSTGHGMTHTTQAKEVLTEMITFENTRLTSAVTSSLDAQNRVRLFAPLGLLFSTLLLVWAGQQMFRLLTSNLNALTENTRRIAAGDYTHQIEPLRVRELDVLSSHVHHMAAAVAEREHQLQEQQATLEHANRNLQRSNRELERFAYVASHDLQEPLRTIGSYTELLAKRYRGQLDERADKYIDFTMSATQRLKNLIQDLLVFSRVQRATRTAAPVDLNALLTDMRQELQTRLAEVNGQVNISPLPTVTANRELLHHVFLNLLGNALKFHASTRPPVVNVHAERTPDGWVFHVQDNGIGIEEKDHERIFEAFRRLHHAIDYDGSGIGLSVTRSAVEQHGGRIWLTSTPGQGTTFSFTLPDNSPMNNHIEPASNSAPSN